MCQLYIGPTLKSSLNWEAISEKRSSTVKWKKLNVIGVNSFPKLLMYQMFAPDD